MSSRSTHTDAQSRVRVSGGLVRFDYVETVFFSRKLESSVRTSKKENLAIPGRKRLSIPSSYWETVCGSDR